MAIACGTPPTLVAKLTKQYSICKPESAHAFVLTVNLVYNELNFLLSFEATLIVFCPRI